MTRTPREIVGGDAFTWSTMSTDQLRIEHEVLRRELETAYRQQAALVAKVYEPSNYVTRNEAERWFCIGVGASIVYGGTPLAPVFHAEWERDCAIRKVSP